jgi:3-oxoacyl-[acyl-carrier protein] reductase
VTVALVTGATRGIGRCIALRLATEGYEIAIGYGSDEQAASKLAESLCAQGARARSVGGDLADPAVAEAMVADTESRRGPVGILVANAGERTPSRRLEEIEPAEWDRIHAVNLRAPFLLARRVLPGMLERGHGRIVMISSAAAFTGGMIGAHYASSKAGLHGLVHSIAKEGAPHGVTANAIAPALVVSDMLSDDPADRERLAERIPVGRLGEPEEVADLVAAVIGNGYLTSQVIGLDGGMHPA